MPTRIDAIRKAALTCRQLEGLDIAGCHITADVIEAIVGTPLGDQLGALDEIIEAENERTNIEPAAFLAAARGFPKLAFLQIPRGSTMGGPHFYIELSRTTANITSLQISDVSTTDACIAAACSHLRLDWLEVDGLYLLSSSIVDGITRSQSAATLSHLQIAYCAQDPLGMGPLRAADILRLLQGCPELDELTWYCHGEWQEYAELDRGTCQAILDLLESRGTTPYRHYFGELDAGHEDTGDCIFEC